MSHKEQVKFVDLTEIIKFISNKAWYLATCDLVYSQIIHLIFKRYLDMGPFVITRHQYFYEYTNIVLKEKMF